MVRAGPGLYQGAAPRSDLGSEQPWGQGSEGKRRFCLRGAYRRSRCEPGTEVVAVAPVFVAEGTCEGMNLGLWQIQGMYLELARDDPRKESAATL